MAGMQKAIVTISLVLLLSCVVPAQTNSDGLRKSTEAPCEYFAMRIAVPSDKPGYKLRITKPVEGIDYKAKVIHPCPMPSRGIARLEHINPKIQPGLNRHNFDLPRPKFALPLNDKSGTSSEVLKEF